MASFTLAAPAATLASCASSLSGMKVGSASRPAAGLRAHLPPVVAAASAGRQTEAQKEQEMMKRRALVFGAFASSIVLAANMRQDDAALAETDPRKKRNKCPTICVQNPTASCCFSF